MRSQQDSSPIILGCGFLGNYLCRLLDSKQHSPLCIVRSEASLKNLLESGDHAEILDLDSHCSALTFNLSNRDVYYFAPPSSADLYDHRIDQFLELCRLSPPNKIVYISTSGVYGNCNGNWVDESQPLNPISDRATRRVYAETALKNFCQSAPTKYVILRVGGIYGRERLPIQRLNNITVICPEEAPYSNRIHVADLAKICHAAMVKSIDNEVINVADGHATSMSDYYYKIADYAGLPRPPCVPLAQANEKLSASMLSFINESRRLSIKKMQVLLNVKLDFPTLEQGLDQCFNKPV